MHIASFIFLFAGMGASINMLARQNESFGLASHTYTANHYRQLQPRIKKSGQTGTSDRSDVPV